MENGNEKRQCPFASNGLIDNLIDWSEKLKALGEVWSALSWHDNNGTTTETLQIYGETLGRIVADYADLINNAVQDSAVIFFNHDKNAADEVTIKDAMSGG